MATFLDALRAVDWDEYERLVNEAITKRPQVAGLLNRVPGSFVEEAAQVRGIRSTGFLRELTHRLGGYPNNPEQLQSIRAMVYALYGPQEGVADESVGQQVLTRSWVASALGTPLNFSVSIPVARSARAAGELLRQFLSLQGAPGSVRRSLEDYYRGSQSIDDNQAAALLMTAIEVAGAMVYSSDTLYSFQQLIYDALDRYYQDLAAGRIGTDTNFIEYFLSHAAYWLDTYFPGLDPEAILATIDQIERREREGGVTPQAESPETASLQEPVPAEQGQAPASQPAQTVAQAPGGLNEILRSEEIVVTYDPRINQPRNKSSGMNSSSGMRAMRYDMGSGRVAMATASPDEVFSDITRYLDQGGPYPLLPDMPVDQAIVSYNSWRTQRGLSPLSPAETEALRSLYSVYRPRI